MICEHCDRDAPYADRDDAEEAGWVWQHDTPAKDGRVWFCPACNLKDWQGNPWRQKAEPRPA